MTGKKHISGLFLILSFFVSVTLATIGGVNAQNPSSSISNIKLPTIYQNKLDDFLANNTVMKDNDAKNYTLNFVEKEMESDRGISKENQLLFIRHAIYKQVTDQDLYNGQDGSQKLAEDFSNKAVNIRIRACGQKYRNGIITYMNKLSADAQQRSADAQQRSADAIKETMKADSLGLKEIVKFYNFYQRSPNIVKESEINQAKGHAEHFIKDCKKFGINYRAILLKEVGGDAKKVDEILKFYGVE